MDRLPKEIVLLIISDFKFKEKLQCALVCRKWLNWIRETSLYNQISIYDDKKRYRGCLDYFEQHEYGRLVSFLNLQNCGSTLTAFLKLPELFPNLKILRWVQRHDEDLGMLYPVYRKEVKDKFYEKQLQKWKHLEKIFEEDLCFPITTALLKSPSSAKSLKRISISCPQNELETSVDDLKSRQSMATLLKYIHNAPGVRWLELENIQATWEDMDRLHRKLPKLEYIRFSNMFLRPIDDDTSELDNNILESSEDESVISNSNSSTASVDNMPAESLEYFSLYYTSDIFEYERGNIHWWIRYMAQKYTNIKYFSLTYDSWIFMPISATSFEETMEFCLASWPTLKKYDVKPGGLTKLLLNVMDNTHIALDELTIYIESQEANEQFNNLMDSKQINSIKTLRILERAKFTEDEVYGSDMFALFRKMTKLQHLSYSLDITSRTYHNLSLLSHTLNNSLCVETVVLPFIQEAPKSFVPISHDTKLRHIEIDYMQFCADNSDIKVFNDTMTDILNHCPLLESFKACTNLYEDKVSDTVFEFDFTKNHHIKTIQIESLYKRTYRIIRAGKMTYYRQTEDRQLTEASPEDITSPILSIRVNKHFPNITTKVFY